MSAGIEERIRAAIQWRVIGDSGRDLVRQTGNSAAIVQRVTECELITRYVRVQVLGTDGQIPLLVECDGPTEWHRAEADLVRFDRSDGEHGEYRMIA